MVEWLDAQNALERFGLELKSGIAQGVQDYRDGLLSQDQLRAEMTIAITNYIGGLGRKSEIDAENLERIRGVRIVQIGAVNSAVPSDFGEDKLKSFYTGIGFTCFIAALWHPNYGIAASHTDSFSPKLTAKYWVEKAHETKDDNVLLNCKKLTGLLRPETLDVVGAVSYGLRSVVTEFREKVLGDSTANVPQGTVFMHTGLGSCNEEQVIAASLEIDNSMLRGHYAMLSNCGRRFEYQRKLGEKLGISWNGNKLSNPSFFYMTRL